MPFAAHWKITGLGGWTVTIQEIISKNPYHIDAYHHLSMIYEENELNFEAYLCCREAVRIGLSAIPEDFSWASSILQWSHLDNRPFLRAYHNLGLWLEKRKEVDEAIIVYGNMLSVCPNDNIGVRYILPKLWIEAGNLLSIEALAKLPIPANFLAIGGQKTRMRLVHFGKITLRAKPTESWT